MIQSGLQEYEPPEPFNQRFDSLRPQGKAETVPRKCADR